MKDITDEELMVLYQTGDAQAFQEIYSRHSGRVYGFLKLRLKSHQAVEEVFQNVFLKLHKSKSQYDSKYTLLQWLFVIARTSLIDFVRQRQRQSQEMPVDQPELLRRSEDDFGFTNPIDIDATLSHLSGQQRQVVELRILEDKDYKEIAQILGSSEDSIRQIFSRAIRKLRGLVNKEEVGHE